MNRPMPQFPIFLFHVTKGARLIENEQQWRGLSDWWQESPAEADAYNDARLSEREQAALDALPVHAGETITTDEGEAFVVTAVSDTDPVTLVVEPAADSPEKPKRSRKPKAE